MSLPNHIIESAQADEAEETGPDRRSLMRAAALIAVPVAGIGTVAACANGSNSTAVKPAGGSGDGATNTGGSGSGGGAGKLEVAQADVPVGGGKIGSGVVVTQPVAGTFKAFTAICTHAGCTVSEVSQNQISCPCHGSVFSAKDGSVLQGPAPSPLTALTVTVAGANVDVTGMSS